jgi:hypothetical protein
MPSSHGKFAGLVDWLPLLAALVFVAMFAIATPLTDEWLLLRNAAIADSMGWADPGATIQAMTWKIYQHPLILPNLLYLAIGPLVAYDSRAFVAITLACFALILLAFRARVASGGLVALPVALVLFSPGHFMEFLWGFQFAMALSIALPVAGLALADRVPGDAPWPRAALHFLGALLLVTLGVLSSAGGAFAFPALAALCLCKQQGWERRIAGAIVAGAAFAYAVQLLSGVEAGARVASAADAIKGAAMLGAVLLGSPVAVSPQSMPGLALVGIAVLACMLAACVLALRAGSIGKIAFPIGLFVFGITSVAAIAVSRDYVGNWHLAAALPALVGMYGAAIVVCRDSPQPALRTLRIVATGLMLLSLVGYAQGFGKRGPDYQRYALSIRAYMDAYLEDPGAARPFPVTGGWDYDPRMALFYLRNGKPTH